MGMKRLLFVACLVCLSKLAIWPPHADAAANGTAWGTEIGAVECSGLGTERTCVLGLSAPGIDVSTYTAVYCQHPYDTWCEGIAAGETVVLSYSLQRQSAPCVGHFFYEPYMDGVLQSHYCASGRWLAGACLPATGSGSGGEKK